MKHGPRIKLEIPSERLDYIRRMKDFKEIIASGVRMVDALESKVNHSLSKVTFELRQDK